MEVQGVSNCKGGRGSTWQFKGWVPVRGVGVVHGTSRGGYLQGSSIVSYGGCKGSEDSSIICFIYKMSLC